MKFVLALFIQTLAFGVLYLSSLMIAKNGLVMPGWLILSYLFIAIGELLVMPIGLAMVGELLPPHITGVMLGVFFISLGLGGKLAGVFANIAAIDTIDLHHVSLMESIYQHSFLRYFIYSLIVSLLCYALVPTLKKWIGNVAAINNAV